MGRFHTVWKHDNTKPSGKQWLGIFPSKERADAFKELLDSAMPDSAILTYVRQGSPL